jgi:hypothetical protein
MRDAIRMVFLVEGDSRLGPPEPRWGGEGVDNVHSSSVMWRYQRDSYA